VNAFLHIYTYKRHVLNFWQDYMATNGEFTFQLRLY